MSSLVRGLQRFLYSSEDGRGPNSNAFAQGWITEQSGQGGVVQLLWCDV